MEHSDIAVLHRLLDAAAKFDSRAGTMRHLLVVIVVGTVGCGIHPKPPVLPDYKPTPIPKASSVLRVRLTTDLAPAIAKLEDQVPKKFGVAKWTDNDDIKICSMCPVDVWAKYQAERSSFLSPNAITIQGTSLLGAIDVKYRAGAHAAGVNTPAPWTACADTPDVYDNWDKAAKVSLVITKDLSLGPSWTFDKPATLSVSAKGERCVFRLLGIPMKDGTDQVTAYVDKLTRDHKDNFDRLVARDTTLRNGAELLWRELAASRPLPWLQGHSLRLHPEAMGVSSFALDNGVLSATAFLQLAPVIESETIVYEPPKFPAPSVDSGETGFQLFLNANVENSDLSQELARAVVGKRVFSDDGKRAIDITAVDYYGLGPKLVLKVSFTGAEDGEVYFIGTPQFDAKKSELVVPDLDFDLNTRDLLLKVASWLAHDSIRDFFRARAKLDLRPALATASSRVHEIVNAKYGAVSLTGTTSLGVSGFEMSQTQLHVGLKATGQLSAEIKQ